MEIFWGIVSFLGFLAGALTWSRLSRPARLVDWIIFPFLYLGVQIVAAGLVLSEFGRLASAGCWAISGLVLSVLAGGLSLLRPPAPGMPPPPAGGRTSLGAWWISLPSGERRILKLILTTLAVVGLLNASVVLFSAPHTWDNLAYRLARVGYFLQHGHLGYYDANYVQQVVVQKNCSLLILFSLVVSGRNENLAQIWQFLAYLTAASCVFGISREIGQKRSAALLAAGVFALLTVCLMQSTTTQSDMLLAAFAGVVAYALLVYRRGPRSAKLLIAALGFGMGWGVKASFSLFVPSFLLIAAYVFIRRGRPFGLRGLFLLALFILPALLLMALPAAYWDNYRYFSHPLGPEEFRRVNAYEGRPLSFVLSAGARHLLRQGFDFLTLDGLPALPPIWKIQNALRYPPRLLTSALGLDLERGLVHPWFYFPPPQSHEDYSSWGVLGWTLVWPALSLSVAGLPRRRAAGITAIAALLFIVAHSFSGVYDFGGRTRYLLPATVLALPAAGRWFYVRSRVLKAWLFCFILIGCLSALTAVLFRYRSPILFDQSLWLRGRLTAAQEEVWPLPLRTRSIFMQDRMSQVLRDAPVFDEAIRNYEWLVPPDAAVAAALNPNSVEYVLFGPGLTRKIIPLNSFHRGLQPVPAEADYLLWADDFDEIFNRGDGDIHLGKDLWLRRLK